MVFLTQSRRGRKESTELTLTYASTEAKGHKFIVPVGTNSMVAHGVASGGRKPWDVG